MRFLFSLVLFVSLKSFAGDTTKLYNPAANVKKDVAAAVAKAKKEGKHVMLQVGGNWCIWCARFHEFVTKDAQLDSLMNANYVVYHLNYSKENYNAKLLTKYHFIFKFIKR